MSDLTPGPAELLTERLSDKSRTDVRESKGTRLRWDDYIARQKAFNDAGLIAFEAVALSANAGNVRCKEAQKLIDQILKPILK
jgi:hypothetical protein